jgi:hypothetical protein
VCSDLGRGEVPVRVIFCCGGARGVVEDEDEEEESESESSGSVGTERLGG